MPDEFWCFPVDCNPHPPPSPSPPPSSLLTLFVMLCSLLNFLLYVRGELAIKRGHSMDVFVNTLPPPPSLPIPSMEHWSWYWIIQQEILTAISTSLFAFQRVCRDRTIPLGMTCRSCQMSSPQLRNVWNCERLWLLIRWIAFRPNVTKMVTGHLHTNDLPT